MIQVEHLTKRYGGHTAVDDISFTVEDGCIRFGFLGVKNLGKGVMEQLVRERDQNGPFHDLDDLCETDVRL